jgi:hypothetical protein
MLANGVRLSLLAGPGVPVPVPSDILDSLTSVSVTVPSSGPSAFELSFEIGQRSPLHTLFLLTGGALPPIFRVVLIAILNGTPEPLIDGVITKHDLSSGEGGRSTLRVTGEDLSRVMDYIPFDGLPYPAMPPEARVLICLAKYAVLGVIPKVIPSVLIDVPVPTSRIPIHHGTDLAYMRALAEDVGYTFYLEPGPAPGTSFGYWGPLLKVGVPQPALNIDMDAHTNVESLSFSVDTEAKATQIVWMQEPLSKAIIPVPVPTLNPLAPPLGLIPLISKRFENMVGTGGLSTPQAIMRALAADAAKAGGVSAQGSLNVVRYGRLLRARALVGVRGAGPSFDGLYYVESVTHSIKRGEYKQSFRLNRGEVLSITPRVPA